MTKYLAVIGARDGLKFRTVEGLNWIEAGGKAQELAVAEGDIWENVLWVEVLDSPLIRNMREVIE